jgi:hypothetical protein
MRIRRSNAPESAVRSSTIPVDKFVGIGSRKLVKSADSLAFKRIAEYLGIKQPIDLAAFCRSACHQTKTFAQVRERRIA